MDPVIRSCSGGVTFSEVVWAIRNLSEKNVSVSGRILTLSNELIKQSWTVEWSVYVPMSGRVPILRILLCWVQRLGHWEQRVHIDPRIHALLESVNSNAWDRKRKIKKLTWEHISCAHVPMQACHIDKNMCVISWSMCITCVRIPLLLLTCISRLTSLAYLVCRIFWGWFLCRLPC